MDTLQMIRKLHRYMIERGKKKISQFDWKNNLNENCQMEREK